MNKERLLEIPLIERLKQNEKYAFWFTLQGPDGKSQGERLLKEIIYNPKINEVIFAGAPGIGKTTSMKTLRSILEDEEVQKEMLKARSGNEEQKIPIATVLSDDCIKAFSELMDRYPQYKFRKDWPPVVWSLFSEFFSATIDRVREGGSFVLAEMVIANRLVEVDGVGVLKDVCYSTFQKQIRKDGVIVYAGCTDLEVQANAASLRTFATSIEYDEEKMTICRPPELDVDQNIDDYTWLAKVLKFCFGIGIDWRFKTKPENATEAAIAVLKNLSLSGTRAEIEIVNTYYRKKLSEYILKAKARRKFCDPKNSRETYGYIPLYPVLIPLKENSQKNSLLVDYNQNIFLTEQYFKEMMSADKNFKGLSEDKKKRKLFVVINFQRKGANLIL